MLNYGCSVNKAEGEAMAGVLIKNGFELVKSEDEADIVVVNTCGVKTPTENKILNRLSTIEKSKKIIVTGCLPKIIGVEKIVGVREVDGILGPAVGEEIIEAVKKVLEGIKYIDLNGGNFSNLLPCFRENKVIGKIVISQGCKGACSYCATRFARGMLKSYSIDEIVSAIMMRINEGAKEIWLSSQDNSIYGLDRGNNIVELLEKISQINRLFLVRIGMMNPLGILKHIDDLIGILKREKFFKFVHIPLQSGSNKVLKDMNRGYSIEDFMEIISRIRKDIPNVSIETDIIVGYPTESDEDFEETLRVISEIKPDFLNISKFYPRPNTPAFKLPKLSTQKISERSRKLSEISSKIKEERNRIWIGWEGLVIIDEIGTVPGSFIARNIYYKPVVIKQPVKLGSFAIVRVTSCKPNFLIGEVIKNGLKEEEVLNLLRN